MAISTSEFPKILGAMDRFKFKSKTQAKFKELTATNPDAIIKYCCSQHPRHRATPEQEAVIISGGRAPVERYMKELSIKNWPAAEPVLAQNAASAMQYSLLERKAFPAGEAALAQDPRSAFLYASEVLNARFPAGEAAIKTKPGFWKAYCNNFGVQE